MHYNFCRIHKTLRVTPAMEAGLTDHVWTIEELKAVADNLLIDDLRVEEILRTHLKLPGELWTQFRYHDVYLTGTDAVSYGMADEIGEFSPPAGTKVLNALG